VTTPKQHEAVRTRLLGGWKAHGMGWSMAFCTFWRFVLGLSVFLNLCTKDICTKWSASPRGRVMIGVMVIENVTRPGKASFVSCHRKCKSFYFQLPFFHVSTVFFSVFAGGATSHNVPQLLHVLFFLSSLNFSTASLI
jgi:hypothetical protein